MGAHALRQFLDAVRPKVILIEGPADATSLIGDITSKKSVPPIAMLAYTTAPPVETLLYPLARYSPEYQALAWAKSHRVKAQFIDLPSDVFLGLNAATERSSDQEEIGGEGESETCDRETVQRKNIYSRFAARFGETDYDTFWERHFEHNGSTDSYRLAALELGRGLRERAQEDRFYAENLVREAYMRRVIAAVIATGVDAKKIVAVVGAFHAPVLDPDDHEVLSDDDFSALPRLDSALTLMPYSYFRLSSQSGYGAGNPAPAYFELFYEALERDTLQDLPANYIARIARTARDAGSPRSTAEVIEGVRLAHSLAGFKDVPAPTLEDLHDAAVTLIGHGEPAAVREAIARTDVGTAVGRLADGVAQTSIQADFNRLLGDLRLVEFRTPVRRELRLDLRENRRAKTETSAFGDLRRSELLHRLQFLGVGFGKKFAGSRSAAQWAETWELQWTDECEIELVESVLLGETVELACAFQFKTRLEECTSIADAATMVREACECGLANAIEGARRTLQALGAESGDFVALAAAAHELGAAVRYGDLRRVDAEPLRPLIDELFIQGCLSLSTAASCDPRRPRQVSPPVSIDSTRSVSTSTTSSTKNSGRESSPRSRPRIT